MLHCDWSYCCPVGGEEAGAASIAMLQKRVVRLLLSTKKRRAKEPVKYHQEDKTNPGRFKRRRKETTWLSSLKAVPPSENKR